MLALEPTGRSGKPFSLAAVSWAFPTFPVVPSQAFDRSVSSYWLLMESSCVTALRALGLYLLLMILGLERRSGNQAKGMLEARTRDLIETLIREYTLNIPDWFP